MSRTLEKLAADSNALYEYEVIPTCGLTVEKVVT